MTTTDISLALLLGPQLRAFKAAGYDVVGVSAAGSFVPQLEHSGIRHIEMRYATRGRSAKSDALAVAELYRILRRLNPQIVHTHNPKPGIYGRIAGAAAGVPVVLNTVHGLYASRDDRFLRRATVYGLERLAASFSDLELVQNVEDIKTLKHLGVPSARLQYLGNGVDLNRFSRGPDHAYRRSVVRKELGASEETTVVTAVGRLVWEKGYRELFDCVARVRRVHPKALFVVAGPLEPSKADGITREDMAAVEGPDLRFLGHRELVEDLYAGSDVFVLPSYREGFPRAAMEAAAMGLPIVATDVRGCRQVVDAGRTGILVPPRDATALANAIIRLAGDGGDRRRMGEAGAAKAKAEFDQARVIETTLGAYDRLLGTRTHPDRR